MFVAIVLVGNCSYVSSGWRLADCDIVDGGGYEINGKEEDTVVSRGLGSHLRFACLSFVGLVGCRCFCGS